MGKQKLDDFYTNLVSPATEAEAIDAVAKTVEPAFDGQRVKYLHSPKTKGETPRILIPLPPEVVKVLTRKTWVPWAGWCLAAAESGIMVSLILLLFKII